jgi:hypothetical protein
MNNTQYIKYALEVCSQEGYKTPSHLEKEHLATDY